MFKIKAYVHMNQWQLVMLTQVSNPGVNSSSVYVLTRVSVHMDFYYLAVTLRAGLPILQHQVSHLAQITFSCGQRAKVTLGQV